MKKFSAGAVKYGFWFPEFVSVLNWVMDGDTDAEIQHRAMNENPFELPSAARRQNVTGCLLKRVHAMPEPMQTLFISTDTENQRLIVLISIMKTDPLIELFILDCFKEAVVLGDEVLEDYELDSFFSHLQVQREDVASWQPATIERLKNTIRNYLRSAGIAQGTGEELRLRRVLMDTRLVTILQDMGNQNYIYALTGRENG
ncbi:DUF1819 family protein [Lacticaseibacillus salsurivasis]|uniref:DUF1819 family protein n=1 Tax=Lacticaseibacillus salsurivasis TaxID=3081441 RepID=UPI0030C75DE4